MMNNRTFRTFRTTNQQQIHDWIRNNSSTDSGHEDKMSFFEENVLILLSQSLRMFLPYVLVRFVP